ncbi:MAG: N-acyl homoserine lactonase family protein [Gammaproteobacteria bacterium]
MQPWEVHAIKYAERQGTRAANFIGGDPHDGPMPMDYFCWAIVGAGRTFVLDTGFMQADAAARGRTLLRTAAQGLALVGVDATRVQDVILSHLHYDHVGGFEQFPNARLHLQDREMQYATGRHMARPFFGWAYEPDHIAGMVRQVFAGRVAFHDGDAELAPGLSVHLIGGHTHGLQAVRVFTRSGWLVLASDAAHFYENIQGGRPFPIVHSVADMFDGWSRLAALADDPAAIVPGHDPLVLALYPAAGPGLEGRIARLDLGRA